MWFKFFKILLRCTYKWAFDAYYDVRINSRALRYIDYKPLLGYTFSLYFGIKRIFARMIRLV